MNKQRSDNDTKRGGGAALRQKMAKIKAVDAEDNEFAPPSPIPVLLMFDISMYYIMN
jgi:hypothetical protein